MHRRRRNTTSSIVCATRPPGYRRRKPLPRWANLIRGLEPAGARGVRCGRYDATATRPQPHRPTADRRAHPGAVHVRTGTFGAHPLDVNPSLPQGGRCAPSAQNVIDIGSGGSGTFEFDLRKDGHIQFKHLMLHVDAGGADSTNMGRVWDWRARRWVKVNLALGYARLRHPGRFVSPQGKIILKLVNSDFSQDIRIADVHRNLQISGDGLVA